MEVVILVKCTTFKQYNMCHIWHSLKDATAQNKNAHIWAGLTFHIYFFLECKLCIITLYDK